MFCTQFFLLNLSFLSNQVQQKIQTMSGIFSLLSENSIVEIWLLDGGINQATVFHSTQLHPTSVHRNQFWFFVFFPASHPRKTTR